ncbi:hypothetical protein [Marinoscillum sp.]|uniref:hypothetical protein n=1 Tax=Marinoscillum sp. TaxID=2024838 RepID=UPI003BAA7316
MKKLTMSAAVLLTVMSVAFAAGDGTNENRARVIASKSDIFKVLYVNSESPVVKIRLRDNEGKLIHTDRVKNEGGFMKPYDLSKLENGTYYFEFTDQYGVISEKIELQPEKESSTLSVKALENKKYELSVEQNEKLPLLLTIYNSNEEVLYKERYQDMKNFSRVYDLSKFDSQNFVFELTDHNSTRIVSVD